MPHGCLKIGPLAQRVGISVRTLHHYDHIGLVRRSARTGSGHRLYSPRDLQRLTRVLLLRDLGLSLDEIAHSLNKPGGSLAAVRQRHAVRS